MTDDTKTITFELRPGSKYPRLALRRLDEIKAHPDGVRTATAEAVFGLRESLKEFGWLRLPFVVNVRTGHLIDGDRMLEALRASADMQLVPVWEVDVPEALEDAAHLALQNHAGDWQWEAVARVLKAVPGGERGLRLTGFHESDTGPLTAADWKPAAKGPLDGADANQVEMFS